MPTSPNDLLKLILDSKALSIWNHKTGPVFWYILGVPGPFYLNTELMIGRELSAVLLDKITTIIAQEPDPKLRAAELNTLIMAAYRDHKNYRTVIEAMVEQAKTEFPKGSYSAISGGERRDWLFSIPVAVELGIKHIYLFKNQSKFCGEALQSGEKVLHLSDLINNAASYFDSWLPILKACDLVCAGTLTVNTRGSVGLTRLREAGYKVAALNHIDLAFFEEACKKGLIDKSTVEEIALFFASEKEWAKRYLMGNAPLFAVAHLDKKSLERMKSFFDKDPWGLQKDYRAFFDSMRASIAALQAA